MKVLLATMQFARGYGQGTERYVSILAEGLRQRGHAVVICGGDPEQRGPKLAIGDVVPSAERVLHLPTFGLLTVGGTPPADAAALLERERPDIVHVANPAHIGVGLIEAARRMRIRTVATAMDYWWVCPKHTLQHFRGRLCDGNVPWKECVRCIAAGSARPDTRLLAALPIVHATLLPRLFFRRAVQRGLPPAEIVRWKDRRRVLAGLLAELDAVIAPSRAAFDVLVRTVRRDRLHSVPYGLESGWLKGNARPPATPTSSEKLTIGYAGALAPHKGPHLLVEALNKLGWRRTRVRIAGDGDDERYIARLKKTAENLGIEFVGRLPSIEMPGFFESIDVLIVPSLWPENLPIVVLEALACGVPVLGSDVAGIAECVPNAACRFTVGSADGLAAALAAWSIHPPSPSSFTVHTAEQMVTETLAVYESCGANTPVAKHPLP